MRDLTSSRAKTSGYSGLRILQQIAKDVKGSIIDFSIGDVTYSTSRNICEAAWKALKKGYTHYTPVLGLMELRQALAEKLQRENSIECDPQTEVLIAAGGSEGLMTTFLATIDAEDEVLLWDPYYALFAPMVKICGGKVVSIPLREQKSFQIDLEEIEQRITSRTKMMILCNPHNPTGRVYSREELKAIADIAIEKDLLVLSDETYEKILYDGNQHVSIGSLSGMKERTVTMISLSKWYAMTGWRLAYVVADRLLMDSIAKMHAYNVSAAQTSGQYAAIEAIRGRQDDAKSRLEEYRRRRDFIVKRLNEIRGTTCHMPMGTFYAFPNVSSYKKKSFEIAEYLLKEAKVFAVHGTAYGECGEGYIRFNFAIARNMQEIEEGMDRMEAALKKDSFANR